MQGIFFCSKRSSILINKILGCSEDVKTSQISERSIFLWTLQLKSLTFFEETENG